jgi:hypothetical protein
MVKMVLGVGLEPSSGRGVHPGIPPWVNNSHPLLNSADMNRGWVGGTCITFVSN